MASSTVPDGAQPLQSALKPPDPTSDTKDRLSFAALVAKSRPTSRFPELNLPSRQYGTKEGVPSINFTPSEYHAATKRFEHTLIAKFQAGRPTLQEIRKFMIENWRLSSRCTISSCWDDRHLIIILDNEQDVCTALTHPQRKVGHAFFRLFRWEPDYNPKKEIPKTTKWIRLPGLPIELFDRAIIRSIVSSFAEFLDIDDKTKELSALSYARACIELDVTQTLPNKVWINLPGDKGFFQDVVVEGGMNYCQKCKMHGHNLLMCRKNQKAQTLAVPSAKTITASDYGPDNLERVTIPIPGKPTDEWKLVTRRKPVRGKLNAAKENATTNVLATNGDQAPKVNQVEAVLNHVNNDIEMECTMAELPTTTLVITECDQADVSKENNADSQPHIPSNIKSSPWSTSYSLENCVTCLTLASDGNHTHAGSLTVTTEEGGHHADANMVDSSVLPPQGGSGNENLTPVPHV